MKIVIGCDVDPVLPVRLTKRPAANIWQCLDNVERFIDRAGADLPPITWLIRSDESVRFSTGRFDSGFLEKAPVWRSLADSGHELGWHFHPLTLAAPRGLFCLDPDPAWLPAAHEALARHFVVRSTRTGWDYCNNVLLQRLDALGIQVDFSALPGHIGWQRSGDETVVVDWSRCPRVPYHPSVDDYQRAGALRLLEVPIAQFTNSSFGIATRVLWRLRHGNRSLTGLRHKTRMLTQPWSGLPEAAPSTTAVWAFFFHPEDLHDEGIAEGLSNIARLRRLPGAEFVTASEVR